MGQKKGLLKSPTSRLRLEGLKMLTKKEGQLYEGFLHWKNLQTVNGEINAGRSTSYHIDAFNGGHPF